jgi:hypothetical protein
LSNDVSAAKPAAISAKAHYPGFIDLEGVFSKVRARHIKSGVATIGRKRFSPSAKPLLPRVRDEGK